jgi:hypothetical protein
MALDLFCYATLSTSETTKILENVAQAHPGLFVDRFLISPAKDIEPVGAEIALEFSIIAKCRFLVRLNIKDDINLLPTVSYVLKSAFNSSSLLILLENEHQQ